MFGCVSQFGIIFTDHVGLVIYSQSYFGSEIDPAGCPSDNWLVDILHDLGWKIISFWLGHGRISLDKLVPLERIQAIQPTSCVISTSQVMSRHGALRCFDATFGVAGK